MDNKILNEFIKTTEPEFLRKYALMVTDLLTKAQIKQLEDFFEVKLTLRADKEKPVKSAKIKPDEESKPEPKPVKRPIGRPAVDRPIPKKPTNRPDFMDEPDPNKEELVKKPDYLQDDEYDEDIDENVFDSSSLTKEDIERMKKDLH